jgi:hypothetical protein
MLNTGPFSLSALVMYGLFGRTVSTQRAYLCLRYKSEGVEWTIGVRSCLSNWRNIDLEKYNNCILVSQAHRYQIWRVLRSLICFYR